MADSFHTHRTACTAATSKSVLLRSLPLCCYGYKYHIIDEPSHVTVTVTISDTAGKALPISSVNVAGERLPAARSRRLEEPTTKEGWHAHTSFEVGLLYMIYQGRAQAAERRPAP